MQDFSYDHLGGSRMLSQNEATGHSANRIFKLLYCDIIMLPLILLCSSYIVDARYKCPH